MNPVLYIVAAVVVLGVLIFVHEAGHFVAAKAVGIQVLRFSMGFGRPLLAWRRGETEYWISWIPLGGYVKMAGLEDEGAMGELEGGKAATSIDPARAFDRKPVWQRMIVILAGVTMNVVLAFVIYFGLAAVLGTPEIAVTVVDSVDVRSLPRGAEALATLRTGDRLLRANRDTLRSWNDLIEHIAHARELRLEVAERATPVVVRFDSGAGLPPPDSLRRAVARSLFPLTPPLVGFVEPGRPASRGGLKPRDLVVRVNGDTIRSWGAFLQAIWHAPERPLALEVLRNGTLARLSVVPEAREETDSTSPRPKTYGFIGASGDPPRVYERESLARAVVVGVEETVERAALVLGFLKGLVLRDVSVREVGGPILVAQMSGQAASLGLDWFLNFIAIFSVSLAILNILPIPVLDGGQAVFLVAEAVRGRPLSVAVRARLTQIGMLVLLGIMILAITNDVVRTLPR